MSPGAVWTVARREWTRVTGSAVPVVVLASACLLALFALSGASVDLYATALYLALPLAACPFAAQRVAADTERGLSRVYATTPATRLDVLAGRTLAMAGLLVTAVLLTLPLSYALTEPIAPGSFRTVLPLAGWALLVGFSSILAGTLVGHASRGPSTTALSAGSGLVLAWLFLGFHRNRFRGWADTEAELAAIQAVLRTSPLTWALDAEDPQGLGVAAAHGELVAGLAISLVFLLFVVGAVVLVLRTPTGWIEAPGQHPAAIGLFTLGVVGIAATLLLYDAPAGPREAEASADRAKAGDLVLALEASRLPVGGESLPVDLRVTLRGPANATVDVGDVRLQAPDMTLVHDGSLPDRIHLEARESAQEGEGVAELVLEATGTPHRIAERFPLTMSLEIDGTETVLGTDVEVLAWDPPVTEPLGAGGGPLLLGLAWAVFTNRRMNRW